MARRKFGNPSAKWHPRTHREQIEIVKLANGLRIDAVSVPLDGKSAPIVINSTHYDDREHAFSFAQMYALATGKPLVDRTKEASE